MKCLASLPTSLLGMVLFLSACGRGIDTAWLDLEIRSSGQEEADDVLSLPQRRKSEDREGFATVAYLVPIQFFYDNDAVQKGEPVDPFAARPNRGPGRLKSPRETLENYGIGFPEGSEARYDPDTEVLEITNELDQLELVEAVIESIRSGGEKLVFHHLEILEMNSGDAILLERKAAHHSDHGSEWEAALQLLREGDARLVDSASLTVLSGHRARFECTDGRSGDPQDVSGARLALSATMDTVIGGDEVTVDCHWILEGSVSGPDGSPETGPSFRIESATILIDGSSRLIGGWSSAGDGERRCLAFLSATIQRATP